jgi:dihydrofolate synthase/folylpolyglutamate synthase
MFDGAHNPAGAQTLRDYLVEFGERPLTVVFGGMRDKNLRQMAELLFPLSDQLVLTEVENPRGATLDTLQQLAAGLVAPERIITARSAGEALEMAREKTPATGMVCFTGSLYLIGAVRRIVLMEEAAAVAKSEGAK